MNKYFGFVAFYKEEDIKESEILEKDVIFYQNIEDSLRFFNIEDEIVITKISTDEQESLPDSDYYGYFNVNKTKKFKIEKVYSYDEIIDIMTSNTINEVRLTRFINSFCIKEIDKPRFRKLGCFVSNHLELVQGSKEKVMVKKYGENSNKGC